MFYVRVKLGKSKIHGIGLFADEDIQKGRKVYSSNKKLDLYLSEKEYLSLPKNEQKTISHYGYFDKNKKMWRLAFDDIRFCNHSTYGNLTIKEKIIIAKRDILNGEELTQDYSEFEDLRKELI